MKYVADIYSFLKQITMPRKRIVWGILVLFLLFLPNQCFAETNTSWRDSLAQSIASFDDLGGYCTSRSIQPDFTQTTWQGLDESVNLDNSKKAVIDISKARPSFCSSAVYMAFLKALDNYSEAENVKISKESWNNLKPYTLEGKKYPVQEDGVGAWGRANSNGPGFAVLAHQLGIGSNYYVGLASEYKKTDGREKAFEQGEKYDIMKIFWNDQIGKDERGHLVIYLGETKNVKNSDGSTDNYIYYWSSNGSKTDINAGYGIKKCKESAIKRAIFTHITHPKKINNVEKIKPTDKNQFLSDIGSTKNATVTEIKKVCGIKKE